MYLVGNYKYMGLGEHYLQIPLNKTIVYSIVYVCMVIPSTLITVHGHVTESTITLDKIHTGIPQGIPLLKLAIITSYIHIQYMAG